VADDALVALLRQGAEVWNEWRRKSLAPRPDLSGAVLAGMDLTKADLRRSNLSGSNLRGADLFQADLHEANLLSTDLRGANL
jgi:uncharacterized protein YjbI with pentapeptide repeats